MSVFSPVDAQAIPLLKRCFQDQPFRSCDYTACVTFMWRDYFRTEYAVDGNAVWLRMRYPDGKQDVTGISYEPWHWRYVGVDNAKKIKKSGLTLEEYTATLKAPY